MQGLAAHWKWLVAGFGVGLALLISLPHMRNLVDLIIGVAWPLAFVTVVWWFRSEIGTLVSRMRKISKDGAEFESPQPLPPSGADPLHPALPAPPQRNVPSKTVDADQPDKPSPETTIAFVFQPLVKQQLSYLKERVALLQRTYSGSEAELALGLAADTGAALYLERASRHVFESQLEALEALKWKEWTKAAFRPYYDKAVEAFPAVYLNYSFDQWFNFLLKLGLVSGPDDAIKVTYGGEALKMYMAQQGYSPVPA